MAESFGSDAARYDRTRPRYPDALVARIAAAGGGRDGLAALDVLDVGCGTGISARQFQAYGCRVLGVDADPRMAAFARRGGLETEVAAFEEWDPAGRTFDAVAAGQTWHWVDPVAGAAKAARVLRPGGRLALFWNVFDPAQELAAAFADVYRRVLPDLPYNAWAAPVLDGYTTLLTKVADGIRQAGGAFGEPERWRHDWERRYTRDEWLDQLPTHGGHARLTRGQLDEVLAGVGAAIDAVGGAFTMRYATVTLTAVRTAGPRVR
ncbi:class I SAM-dependent methyltransferase [Streptomyces armeniacus]|uniref:Class I SAM-dependent methyltransferase n=1 Tax=Streptomyces armeniacus TaxID=83291 RepID=A0A345XTQ9_9ACTN|nr:class I SAM-dependent methyltransferase [Streptomyces armeniacus]AXK35025.1 class I SAM-dependent methyltransferase [Streptomyces armeniacus]